MKLFTASIALGLMTFFTLGWLTCRSFQPTEDSPRAYCLEAPSQEPYTVYVSGPSSTILALTDREYGRYVVSEGPCNITHRTLYEWTP